MGLKINRKRRIKVGQELSTWQEILSDVPQSSILRPIFFFNIQLCDQLIIISDTDIANFADDNTLHVS